MPALKIASSDNDFFPLLEATALTGKPTLLSIGRAGIAASKDFIEAVWRRSGRPGALALLHCVVSYPTAPEDASLSAIPDLATLGCAVGFSDHTIGISAAVFSVALGACAIEKHFTLDKNQFDCHDYRVSADLAALVQRVREAEILLGRGGKRVLPCEEAARARPPRHRASRDLAAGTVLSAADLTWPPARKAG